jgi:DNA-directed RNA polymerase subunit RPC12/RpoP
MAMMNMSASKAQIIFDTQAIVSIVAGTAALAQEYETTVFTKCVCSNCNRIYWKLTANKVKYLELYPHCPNCGSKISLNDISEDPEHQTNASNV